MEGEGMADDTRESNPVNMLLKQDSFNLDHICVEKVRSRMVADESMDDIMADDDEDSCCILDEVFARESGDDDDANDVKHNASQDEDGDDDIPIPPLGPFATPKEIETYEYEKKRFQIYKKYNMFYVPSYEDTPQLLPNIASIREESADNKILKKSLNNNSFTYNSWLRRNSYNDSVEHTHVVDEEKVAHPGQLCAKPINKSKRNLVQARRISDVPAYRRPSIASQKQNALLNKQSYTWIEGVHVKSKESVDINDFNNLGVKLRIPDKSPQDCDERLFTFGRLPEDIHEQDEVSSIGDDCK